MKIVKEGNPWWVSKSVTCRCGCEFVLELPDKPKVCDFRGILDSVLCPTCGDILEVPGGPRRAAKNRELREQIAADQERFGPPDPPYPEVEV